MTDPRPQSMLETTSDVDIHQLLIPKTNSDVPRPRDSSSNSSAPESDAGSFFIPEPLSRSNSVYSFSRATLSSQLGSLTSMSLPQAETLAANITALPTAKKAIRALNTAAEQIMQWTKKALKVLKNLDADDDVEWAAAAGREALDDTDKTINRFETLVSVYVVSIEELQTRPDIGDLKHEHLAAVVDQMETTLDSWEQVRTNLKTIHEQVELAMEWEELWNTVLADVASELDNLSQSIFDMEEKRHRAYTMDTPTDPSPNFDLGELESYIEGPPAGSKKRDTTGSRFSLSFEQSPLDSPTMEQTQDDTDLLALFARMQPLRASLDFLPMRLSVWQQRAGAVFPSSCKELDDKCERLEKDWQRLSEDAETLRKELSEDRWVVVFRNAGRQAQKMLDSVERSIAKVREGLEEGYQRSNPAALGKRLESFEAKKTHYMPAVQRVLAIVQKGLKDRLTVNGEILRLHRDLSTKMRDLEDAMASLSHALDTSTPRYGYGGKLRESMSSIMSTDRSIASTVGGTPGSSPASSIDLNTPQKLGRPASKYGLNGYTKPRAASGTRGPPPASANRRTSVQSLRPSTPSGLRRGPSPAPPSIYRQGLYKPPTVPVTTSATTTTKQNQTPRDKPRWSAVVSSGEADRAANYNRPASTTPSSGSNSYAPRSFNSSTTIPFRSPLSRETSASPAPGTIRPASVQLRSFAERVGSPSPARSGLMGPVPYHKSRNANSSHAGTIRSPSSLGMQSGRQSMIGKSSTAIPIRPPSSLSKSQGANRGSLPVRIPERSKFGHHTPRSSIDSGRSIPISSNGYNDHSHDEEHELDMEEEDEMHDDASSPLSRRSVNRPASSLAGSLKGRRTSMLPVPVGGRLSSLSHHAN